MDGQPLGRNIYFHDDIGQSSVVPTSSGRQAKQSTSTSKSATPSTTTTTSSSQVGSPAGPRFQCPKCPKNFSRIENLTRHQANHEDVGKFSCAICKKRFTRSDLLSRHRRIHASSSSPSDSKTRHVTQIQFGSVPPPSNPLFERSHSQENVRSKTPREEGLSGPSHPGIAVHLTPPLTQQDGYLSTRPNQPYRLTHTHGQFATSNPSSLPQSQGLTNLMEAALAPEQQFSPAKNINLNLWDDGFMGSAASDVNSYMGSYDADISWAMSSFNAESLSNYSSDYDMLNTFGDAPQTRYQFVQYPSQQAVPIPENKIDAADNEDEDTNDWPDKVNQPNTPPRQAPRIVPIELIPISWQPLLDEARTIRPTPPTLPNMQRVNSTLRQSLIDALNGDFLRNEVSIAEISDAMFPPPEALGFFLCLYVQYIQPRFPVLHLPTFDLYACPPLLLVAMMLLGSSHSFSDRGRFSRIFHHHLRIACLRMQELDSQYLRSLDNIFTYFLLCLAGTWSGSKESYEFAEGARGVLVTACRRMRLLDCRPSSLDISKFQKSGFEAQQAKWLAWVESEKGKRLGLSVYMFDSQYPALFNNQHFVSKAETTNCVFPCNEDLWEARSPESWKALLGPTDLPKPEYWLRALNCCLLRRYIKPAPPIIKTGEFGKILLLYAIHTHIFDWRQATCMLAPTGLMGINAAWDMGNPLRERRVWLINALDSWAECYQDEKTSIAACLLHRLGYISLDLNLSDMHLVAGRSNNQDDGNFAEQNLKRWANSEMANSTMSHIYGMLQICHHHVENDTAADSSYEIAVCLFTGGIVCWAFARLNENAPREECMEEVRKASKALRRMGCWRNCSLFGRILKGFETKAQIR